MASQNLDTLLLLDSKDTPWIEGPGWTEVNGAQFVGHSSAWAEKDDGSFLTINFNGTGISCIGNTVDFAPWNFSSSLDGESPEYHAMTLGGYDQITYDWFNVSGLAEGQHTLNLTSISQRLALDYAAVRPSPAQNIRDQVLIVDDSSPLILYTGTWVESYTNYSRMDKRPATPHSGGTHVGNSVGDTLQFPFTGTEVRIYGFYEWKVAGELSISYTIDNRPTEERVYPLNGTQAGDFVTQPNYLFFETTVLPGDHVLTLNITKITGGQRAIIDTIHYKAAFDSLDTMPQITLPNLSKTEGKSSLNVGAIVGGVVGGIAGSVVVIVLILFLLRRHRANKPQDYTPVNRDDEAPGSQLVVEPFTLPPSFAPVRQDAEGTTRLKFEGPKHSTTFGWESTLSVTSGSGTAPNSTDTRVEQLERQVQQLARETARLHSAEMPPPYQ